MPEIIAATGWYTYTVRGFGSILGSKGGKGIKSAKNEQARGTYRIAK